MGQFDHYPDMNQDGKHDLYDCVVFHEMAEEDEKNESRSSSHHSYNTPITTSVTNILIFIGVLMLLYALLNAFI